MTYSFHLPSFIDTRAVTWLIELANGILAFQQCYIAYHLPHLRLFPVCASCTDWRLKSSFPNARDQGWACDETPGFAYFTATWREGAGLRRLRSIELKGHCRWVDVSSVAMLAALALHGSEMWYAHFSYHGLVQYQCPNHTVHFSLTTVY